MWSLIIKELWETLRLVFEECTLGDPKVSFWLIFWQFSILSFFLLLIHVYQDPFYKFTSALQYDFCVIVGPWAVHKCKVFDRDGRMCPRGTKYRRENPVKTCYFEGFMPKKFAGEIVSIYFRNLFVYFYIYHGHYRWAFENCSLTDMHICIQDLLV